MTICSGESIGGRTSPLSSPCTPTITPIILVEMAKVFCHAYFSCSSLSKNFMLYAFANICPSWWQSGPCSPFPVGSTNSIDIVYSAPGNVSLFVFLPTTPYNPRCFLQISWYISITCGTSSSASFLLANTVCPSFHKNSLVLRKGTACLNSQRTTLFHWFSFKGRSLHDLIH